MKSTKYFIIWFWQQARFYNIMSKKNISKSLNPLPSIPKSSKKPNKQALNHLGDFINDESDISPDMSSESAPRLKKLKKIGDKNKPEPQRFIKEKSQSQYSEQENEQSVNDQEQGERFQRLDDEGIAKAQNQMMNKKSKKKQQSKKEGEQEIDKFLQKQTKSDKPKPKKEDKAPVKTQMSLKAMFQLSSQPKKTIQPIFQKQSQSQSGSESEDELEVYRKRQAMMKANSDINAGLNEAEAIKKAMQESLMETKESKQQIPIDNYSFNRMMNTREIHPKQEPKKQVPKPKTQDKKIEPAAAASRKRQKSVGKKQKQQKPMREGPLKGLGIVLTGQFEPYTKNQILQLLEQLGADTPKSITKKTTHLLQGCYIVNTFGKRTNQDVKTTSKSMEAAQKNVPIIAFQNLDDFFIQKTGKSLAEHFEKDKHQRQYRLDQRLVEVNKNTSTAKTASKMDEIDEEVGGKLPISNKMSWTEKYKPKSSQEIIGQMSQIKNLREWLEVWEDIHLRGNKREVKQSFNSFMPSGTINSNAALLSGDAGLGKTTAARLIATQFGYSIVEYNASDARNKKSVQMLSVGKNNMSFLTDKSKEMVKTLIIMDEVDGMSSGDRGGIAAIIEMIKKTKVPIICICNDRQAMKIRTLASHCYDIKFHKPDQRMIIKRLERIIELEGGTSSAVALKSLVEMLQNDIRQILTYLEVIFKGGNRNINQELIRKRCRNGKDSSLSINPFEATKILLSRTMFRDMTIQQKTDMCYVDSDMMPLMIHQNYLDACPKKKLLVRDFKKLVAAAESFALSDKMDRTIMKNQNYCLMPNKMFLSCIYPCEMICENIGFPKFTEWLGKFSTERKNKRLIKQLKSPLSCVSSVNFQSIKNHYVPMLLQRIYLYLRVSDPNYDDAVEFMIHYGITPLILNEHILSLQYKDRQNLLKGIDTIKKTKLTKLFNKKHETLKTKKEKKKAAAVEHMKYDPVLGEMEQESEENEEEGEKSDQEGDIVVEKKAVKSKPKKK